jgi:hypothetical protein
MRSARVPASPWHDLILVVEEVHTALALVCATIVSTTRGTESSTVNLAPAHSPIRVWVYSASFHPPSVR